MSPTDHVTSRLLRSRIGKVCVAVTGRSADELCERAAAVLRESSFLEFRLDYLSDPSSALPAFREFLQQNNAATVVATCRPRQYGGRFQGSPAQAVEVLVKAGENSFHLVDLDLSAAETLGPATVERLRATGAGIILSNHDFKHLGDLNAIYARMEPFAPDFAKIAGTANSLLDNLTMLRYLQETEDRAGSSLVGICMGEKGMLSRVLGLRAGAAFTFASATAGEETAPGQIAARALLETYRIDQLDKATKIFGVAGDPISSSLSPLMLNTAFRKETVNAVYVALATSDPKELLQLAREIPLGGMSITMPLKQSILPLLERSDPLATKIGAVNTVLRAQDGKFYGFNTDVAGIVSPLERRLPLRGAKVLVLGAGGAARAAVFGCRDKGAEVSILNRTPEAAKALAKAAGAVVIRREAVAQAAFDVVVNATPAGMRGVGAELLLQPDDLNAKIVFDLVYNPLETPLLKLAKQKGLTAISGLEMFISQGARQFEIWTGKPAPQEEMLRVVLHALRQNAALTTASPEAPKAEVPKHGEPKVPPASTPQADPARAKASGISTSSKMPAPVTAAAAPLRKPQGKPVAAAAEAKAAPATKPAPAKTVAKASAVKLASTKKVLDSKAVKRKPGTQAKAAPSKRRS